MHAYLHTYLYTYVHTVNTYLNAYKQLPVLSDGTEIDVMSVRFDVWINLNEFDAGSFFDVVH